VRCAWALRRRERDRPVEAQRPRDENPDAAWDGSAAIRSSCGSARRCPAAATAASAPSRRAAPFSPSGGLSRRELCAAC
jgi:hypothetical protein